MAKKQTGSQPALMTEHSPKEDNKVSSKRGKTASPVKSVKAEKPVKTAKVKNVHYPITDLSKMEFVPRWVYANLPEKPHMPQEGEFSYVLVYRLVRELEPNFVKVPCDVLFDMLSRYVTEHPGTPIAEWWGKELSTSHKRDLKARLHWCMAETLRRMDSVPSKNRSEA